MAPGQGTEADMAPFHKLTNMQVDKRNAHQGLDYPRQGGTECSSDPVASASLHGPECLHGPLEAAVLIVSQLGTIGGDQKEAHMVQELFVLGTESADRVIQRYHGLHCGEGLGGVSP